MPRSARSARDRVDAVLRALIALAEVDGEDDGRKLNREARQGYEAALRLERVAELIKEPEQQVLRGVIERWGCQSEVVRELFATLISELLAEPRIPGSSDGGRAPAPSRPE